MNTASKSGDLPHKEANWVEQCSCGKEYTGQFCQFCAPGYRRVFSFGGPLTRYILFEEKIPKFEKFKMRSLQMQWSF